MARAEWPIVSFDGKNPVRREEYDTVRTAFLKTKGYRVIGFTNDQVMTNPEGIARTILVALRQDFRAESSLSRRRRRSSSVSPGRRG